MKKQTFAALACVAALGGDDDNEPSSQAATTTAAAPAAAGNIVDVAQGTQDLSTLVAAVQAGDLAGTLGEPGPYTVFAPTNDAFAEIQSTVDTLLKPENKDDLVDVLTYHVVPGTYGAADLEDGQELETVQGQTLKVTIDGDTVKVGDATVQTADVDASNGTVHVIDKVLVPPAS
jgi:uncharacterized surface protein with fasciclin (FAS1) repeats